MAASRSAPQNDDLKTLESRVDELIHACHRLRQENQSLKSEHDTLS
jgi:uncharacterized protein (TIGR02449 family)